MNGFKQSLTEIPSHPVHWIFDECFDKNGEYSEADSENAEEEIEQQFKASMETEEQMDAISYNVSDSFFEPMEDDTTLHGVVSNEGEHHCHESVDSDCDVVVSSSLDSNVAPCEEIHEPTSTVTPLEKQQYLQYIVDTVAEHFPDLGFVLGFDGQDRNNPF